MRSMLIVLGACLALVAGGCDDEDIIKAAAAKGILLQKKQVEDPPGSGKYTEKFVVVQDAAKDKVDEYLKIAQGAVGGVPIVGQVLLGLLGLSSLAGNVLLKRMQAIADKKNVLLTAENEQHEATHDATSLALQSFVNAQPAPIGAALKQHLDDVHDHMEVSPEHQDWIQPVTKAA